MTRRDVIDYEVCDRDGERIGTVSSLWVDDDVPDRAFAGVDTDWSGRRELLVPLRHARVDEGRRRLVLPFDRAALRAAPLWRKGRKVSDVEERKLLEFYERRAPAAGPALAPPLERPRPFQDRPERAEAAEAPPAEPRVRRIVRTEIVEPVDAPPRDVEADLRRPEFDAERR